MNITRQYTDRYNALMEDIRLRIEDLVMSNTDGNQFDFEENGFEDESQNDISGVSLENVILADGETYSLHELSFWDGIKIIETIENMSQQPQTKTT